MPMKTSTAPPLIKHSPELLAAVRGLPGGAGLLRGWPAFAAEVGAARCVSMLVAHSGASKATLLTQGLAGRTWELLRHETEPRTGRALDQCLNDASAIADPVGDFDSVFRTLLAAGSMHATLSRQRATLDRVLAVLERAAPARGAA